ncbi:MAG: hypothetical protein HY361_04520 [Candidatus Aenigmarchaeota archaeon]|nr:hypothetical protein [Candidatus Aenigmarchaeota archaeon]
MTKMNLEYLLNPAELTKLDSIRFPNGLNGREFAVAVSYLGDNVMGDSYIAASRVKEQVLGVRDTRQARGFMKELVDAGILKVIDGDYQMPKHIRISLKQLSHTDEALRAKVISQSGPLLADRIAKAFENYKSQREGPAPYLGGLL